MIYALIAAIGLSLFIYSITARQLDRAELTAPMWFVLTGGAIGFVLGNIEGGQQALAVDINGLQTWLPIIELTLAIYLFSDAAKTRLRVLSHSFQLPVKLLLGLPLTMIFGAWVAHELFQLSWLACFLIAVIITPTDATLCKTFIQDKSVPTRLREAINVESGLNDGLCIPVFLFLLGVLAERMQATTESFAWIFIREVGIALVVAGLLTAVIIWLLKRAYQHHYFASKTSPFLFVGIAFLVFSVTQALHGSGFIAAFVSGLLFDKYYRDEFKDQLIEEGEHLAEFAAFMIWIVFGLSASVVLLNVTQWQVWVYAVLATALFRLIPVFLCLLGGALTTKERFTLAWFGPKGLASVVLTLMLLSEELPNGLQITQVAMATVLLSIFVFGLSSRPISKLFTTASGRE
ncbi:sodium:proton antiporter [Pseudoalteromonas sp. GCY]|uniref:cation:proton antiporter n=1 Tax=Pseudoalteromonas sp. GCY TaxID=2003316 RepID=UPI000BFF091B|nr:cation:proton antiporter [Pseudoalteromonas sp. GCY]PHI38592.1 sodium:proton antiporter [Pseudoalteromonas sp. GCY]QQQ67688.1 cation:proton antiporter [Pseudoalteromonas sp. GCY]